MKLPGNHTSHWYFLKWHLILAVSVTSHLYILPEGMEGLSAHRIKVSFLLKGSTAFAGIETRECFLWGS